MRVAYYVILAIFIYDAGECDSRRRHKRRKRQISILPLHPEPQIHLFQVQDIVADILNLSDSSEEGEDTTEENEQETANGARERLLESTTIASPSQIQPDSSNTMELPEATTISQMHNDHSSSENSTESEHEMPEFTTAKAQLETTTTEAPPALFPGQAFFQSLFDPASYNTPQKMPEGERGFYSFWNIPPSWQPPWMQQQEEKKGGEAEDKPGIFSSLFGAFTPQPVVTAMATPTSGEATADASGEQMNATTKNPDSGAVSSSEEEEEEEEDDGGWSELLKIFGATTPPGPPPYPWGVPGLPQAFGVPATPTNLSSYYGSPLLYPQIGYRQPSAAIPLTDLLGNPLNPEPRQALESLTPVDMSRQGTATAITMAPTEAPALARPMDGELQQLPAREAAFGFVNDPMTETTTANTIQATLVAQPALAGARVYIPQNVHAGGRDKTGRRRRIDTHIGVAGPRKLQSKFDEARKKIVKNAPQVVKIDQDSPTKNIHEYTIRIASDVRDTQKVVKKTSPRKLSTTGKETKSYTIRRWLTIDAETNEL